MTAETIVATIAAFLYLATFCMKTMIPLRIVAVCSAVGWFIYSYMSGLVLVMFVELVLIPVNIIRLMELRRIIAQARSDYASGISVEALLPFMKAMRLKSGEVLFHKGETSHYMFYLVSGTVRLEEIGRTIKPGELFGEVSLFSMSRERTATAIAGTDVELRQISDESVTQLYYQNPQFGFYLIRLITTRLIKNYEELKGRVAESNTPLAALEGIDFNKDTPGGTEMIERPTERQPSARRKRVGRRTWWLTLSSLAVAAGIALWFAGPYVKSVFSRDAVVTTWVTVTSSPIQGQIVGSVPTSNDKVTSDYEMAHVFNEYADDSEVVHSAARVERLEAELSALRRQVVSLRTLETELSKRAQAHSKAFKRNLNVKINGLTRQLESVKDQLRLAQIDVRRRLSLKEQKLGSAAAADQALLRTRELERLRSELEKDIEDAKQRLHVADSGVFITTEGVDLDWAYDNLDAVRLEIIQLEENVAMTEARLSEARVVANAKQGLFERMRTAPIEAPEVSLVWRVLVDSGETVSAGQPLIEWINCDTLLVDQPMGDAALALVAPGMTAQVVLEGEQQAREGIVVQKRGAASVIGRQELAALTTKRTTDQGQVLLAIDGSDVSDCPVGQSAAVDFPEISVLDVLFSRLRLR